MRAILYRSLETYLLRYCLMYHACVWTRASVHNQSFTTVVDIWWFNFAFKILKKHIFFFKNDHRWKWLRKKFDFLPRHVDWIDLKIVHLRLNPQILIRIFDLNHCASMFIKTYVMVIWSDKYGSWIIFVGCNIIIWT